MTRNALFTASWAGHAWSDFGPLLAHSLAWVCAYSDDTVIGFVNVTWDGNIHAFLLDTTVHPDWRRRGIGRELVLHATNAARARSMHWLHVDYEPHLDKFYSGWGFSTHARG